MEKNLEIKVKGIYIPKDILEKIREDKKKLTLRKTAAQKRLGGYLVLMNKKKIA